MANSDTESNEAFTVELHNKDDRMQIQTNGSSSATEGGTELNSKEIAEDDAKKNKGDGRKNKDKMAKIMQKTITELEMALKESNSLLIERDKEIKALKETIDHHKKQIAKEIATKTKLAQSLDDSNRKGLELEELLQKQQLSMKDYQQRLIHMETAIQLERSRSVEQEKQFGELYSKKCKEVEQLTSQLSEIRQKSTRSNVGDKSSMDDSQLLFLKQAVFHLLTDSHAEEHLRAIVSMLNFSAQERKAVYAKVQEKKGRASYGTPRSTTPIVLTQ